MNLLQPDFFPQVRNMLTIVFEDFQKKKEQKSNTIKIAKFFLG